MKSLEALTTTAKKHHYLITVSILPRTRNKLKELEEKQLITKPASLVTFMKPIGFCDYNHLQKNAYAVLSNSGTISEELSIMNFSELNIREADERPEAMEEASVMMERMNEDQILQGHTVLEEQKQGTENSLRKVQEYSMPNVSEKVVRIILSYTDYVNRNLWSKS